MAQPPDVVHQRRIPSANPPAPYPACTPSNFHPQALSSRLEHRPLQRRYVDPRSLRRSGRLWQKPVSRAHFPEYSTRCAPQIHVITQWDTGERVYGVGAAGRPDYALAQRKRRLGRRQSVGACCALARSTAKLRFESKHAYPSLRTAVLASGRLGRPWRARDGSGAFFTHHGVRARARKGTARSEVRAPQATFVVVVRQVWVSGAHPTRRRHPSSAALNSLLSPALCLTVRELTVAGWPVLDSLARFSVYWKARLRGGAGVE